MHVGRCATREHGNEFNINNSVFRILYISQNISSDLYWIPREKGLL